MICQGFFMEASKCSLFPILTYYQGMLCMLVRLSLLTGLTENRCCLHLGRGDLMQLPLQAELSMRMGASSASNIQLPRHSPSSTKKSSELYTLPGFWIALAFHRANADHFFSHFLLFPTLAFLCYVPVNQYCFILINLVPLLLFSPQLDLFRHDRSCFL